MLEGYHFQFSTTGGAGASASPALTSPYGGNVSTRPLSGRLLAAYVKYGGSNASTTDVEIKTLGINAPSQSILVLTNANTDGWFYPRVPVVTNAGAAATYNGTAAVLEPAVVNDHIAITVAQGNDKTIDVWLILEC